jgi:hypothetical protein
VPVDTCVGVSPTVYDLDVESEPAFFYGARREDRLHFGGGNILSDWVPFSGNALTDAVGVTYECVVSDLRSEVLFEGELHVGLHHEY